MTFDMLLFELIVLAFPLTQSQSIDFDEEQPQNVFNIRDSLVINTLMTSNLTLPSATLKGRNAKLLERKNSKPSANREYFFIISKIHSELGLVASITEVGEVLMKVRHDGNVQDQQLWFWDGVDQDILRNKKYPKKVINK